MILRRGDIVLADLPYSDQTGSKIRPQHSWSSAIRIMTDRMTLSLF